MDIVSIKSESKDGRKYWNKLKQCLKEEGNETVAICHQLKLKATDGKYRMTDVCDIERDLGETFINKDNTLPYKYNNENEIIENKKEW